LEQPKHRLRRWKAKQSMLMPWQLLSRYHGHQIQSQPVTMLLSSSTPGLIHRHTAERDYRSCKRDVE